MKKIFRNFIKIIVVILVLLVISTPFTYFEVYLPYKYKSIISNLINNEEIKELYIYKCVDINSINVDRNEILRRTDKNTKNSCNGCNICKVEKEVKIDNRLVIKDVSKDINNLIHIGKGVFLNDTYFLKAIFNNNRYILIGFGLNKSTTIIELSIKDVFKVKYNYDNYIGYDINPNGIFKTKNINSFFNYFIGLF